MQHPVICQSCGVRAILDSLIGNDSKCPAWIGPESGIVESNPATGEERLLTGCYFPESVRISRHVIQAANRGAETSQRGRTENAEFREVFVSALGPLFGMRQEQLPQPASLRQLLGDEKLEDEQR